MAFCAYEDNRKISSVNADEVGTETHSKKNIYYCMEPSCPAEMAFVAESTTRRVFFRSISVKNHTCCLCRLRSYEENEDFENHFSFAAFTNDLKLPDASTRNRRQRSASTASNTKQPRYTLKNVCEMLKHYSPEDERFVIPIWKMLLDERSIAHYINSSDIHSKNIIVEAKVAVGNFYNRDNHTVTLERTYGKRTLCFILKIEKENTFKSILKKIFAFDNNQQGEGSKEPKKKSEFRNHYAFVCAAWFYTNTENLEDGKTIEYYRGYIKREKQFIVA